MSARHLHHVTLTTGHVRPRSPRSEVLDETVDALRPVVEAVLDGKRMPISRRLPGYTLNGTSDGRCCAITLWGQDDGTKGPKWTPILTMGIAPLDSISAAGLWHALHQMAHPGMPVITDPAEVPPGPWCADRLEIGSSMYPEALDWTGDLSRCLAWTWIEMLDS